MNTESRRILLMAVVALIVAAALSAARDARSAGAAAQSRVYLPVALHVPAPPAIPLGNGNFEQGEKVWTWSSSGGWDVIVQDFPGSVTPHGGSWAAWLGGDDDETTKLSQQVTVTQSKPVLTYWQWIASEDACGFDTASVRVNGNAVKSYALCESSSTQRWVRAAVNLASFAGQTVTLEFRVVNDDSLNSNLFLDDVAFDDAAVLSQIEDMPAMLPVPGPKADFPDEPSLREIVAAEAR